MIDERPVYSEPVSGISQRLRRESPLLLAMLAVGLTLGGLLVGYEPVGGDPDRMYRPLKTELASALRVGRLPFWSERIALGVPLVAESHVAAFYPPNLLFYRILDVSTAYRLSMWLHYVALAATTYFYARCLGVLPWGGALAGLAFALCGFLTIHSSHEPFYQLMPYLPLVLAFAERFMAAGRAVDLALLSLALGLEWLLGHFQIQTWTTGLVVLLGVWRAAFDRRPWARAALLVGGVLLGTALAAVQLGLSWQFARFVGQTQRALEDLVFYSFPPAHWFELAVPRPIRELRLGPEDPYWFGERTTGFEASLYIGTIPLVFAVIACCARPWNRATSPLRVLAPASFALATLPRWWLWGYVQLLALPGLGYFRVPARYTLLTSLSLAVLAGEGFDRSLSTKRFRLGLFCALVFGGCAAVAAFFWSRRTDVHLQFLFLGIAGGILWAVVAWLLALGVVLAWRSGRLGAWAPLLAAAVELGVLFHLGTTHWGWSIALPEQSPVLSELARRPGAHLVGGEIENLPLRADCATAYPYLGFSPAGPTSMLQRIQKPLLTADSSRVPGALDITVIKRWLRRFRVTHLVGHRPALLAMGNAVGPMRDAALDEIVYKTPLEPAPRSWSIIALEEPMPGARVAHRARTASSARAVVERLSAWDDLELAWFLAEDHVPERADARSAHLIGWDGSVATVEHDGPCDLVVARSYDPGWLARVGDGPEKPVLPVDNGFQAVRLEGTGKDRITFRYRPPRIALWATISLSALAVETAILLAAMIGAIRFKRCCPSAGGPMD